MNIPRLRATITSSILSLLLLASISNAQSITTTFAGGNSLAGVMFDVSTAATGVIINDFDANFSAGTWNVDVWAVTSQTSFEPVHTNGGAWTLLGSSTVTSTALGTATNLGLSLGYLIPPATQVGFYITTVGGGSSSYTNGTNGGGVYVSDAFLSVHEGIGKGTVAGYPATFSSSVGGGTLPFPSVMSRIFNGTIYYSPIAGLTDDLALTSISAPTDSQSCEFLTSAETVTAKFTNYGSNTILMGTIVQFDMIIDGGAAIQEFTLLTGDLTLGQSSTYSFTATANLAAAGAHTIQVTSTLFGDLDASNDSKSIVVNSGNPNTITTFPWIENFESVTVNNGTVPPTGWTQDLTDGSGTNSDWFFKTGTTGSTNTGPNGDHGTGSGYYAYTEDSGNFAQTNLDSPCLDLATLVAPQLDFWLHSFNSNAAPTTTGQNFFSVDVISYPGGTVTMDVAGPIGHQAAANWASSSWGKFSVNLSPFAGQLVQVRFRSQTSGGSTTHDIAIDDIGVFEPVATPGQAPQPGLAVFDIEDSINGNLAGVSFGFGGPYYTNITQGDDFTLHFEGESFQPIVVVYGALNPVAATYPNGIGQFDIGGPGVDPNGIPLNIAVFVNAIGWVQAGAPGFPFDALFFTRTSGELDVSLSMPPFGIPPGTTLTTFQSAIASASSPFVHLSNAIQVTLN